MIDDLRKKIDAIDKQIMTLITERFVVVHKIGEIKKENNIPVFDLERESIVKERLVKIADEENLSKEFVINLYNLILEESRKEQD